MQALAEAEVPLGAAGDVELVGVRELAGVAVRGAVDEHDPPALRDGHAADGDLAGRGPADELQRGGVADRLLHRVADQRRVLQQDRPLVGVLGDQLEERRHQPGGGLGAAEQQDRHEAHDLGCGDDVLVGERDPVDLRLDDVGDQVLAGVAAPLVEQVDEVVADPLRGGLGDRCEAVVAGVAVLELVDPALQVRAARLLGGRQPDQVEEDLHRRGPGQLLGDVDLVAVLPAADELADDLADVRLVLGDAPRQEVRLDDLAELVVPRIVDVRKETRPALVRGGGVDVDALEAEERVVVGGRRADVLPAGQRPPVPLLAVEDRRLLQHPAVHRERVRLELRAVRVVLGDHRPGHADLQRWWVGLRSSGIERRAGGDRFAGSSIDRSITRSIRRLGVRCETRQGFRRGKL